MKLQVSNGCEECRQSWRGLEQIGENLIGRAFHRVDFDKSRYTGAHYESAQLHRCPACGTIWLLQYWELETPETELEEWGERCYAYNHLTEADVKEIEAASTSGNPLPHDRFFAGR